MLFVLFMDMFKTFRNNSLSITFAFLFFLSLVGQFYGGLKEYNKERQEQGQPPVKSSQYIQSGHFIQATFENWESEFLQMALFVLLTIFLYQKGSSESKLSKRRKKLTGNHRPAVKAHPGQFEWEDRNGKGPRYENS